MSGISYAMYSYKCEECSTEKFAKSPSRRRRFCSYKCAGINKSKLTSGPRCTTSGCHRKQDVARSGKCYIHFVPLEKKPLRERFESRFIKGNTNECWQWAGVKLPRGYGTYCYEGGSPKLAHRISYELYKCAIPKGMEIDHLCKNRACVNPKHLEAVTGWENNRRSNSLSAQRMRQTECIRGHKFDAENTYYSNGGRGRTCRKCKSLWREAKRKGVNIYELCS